MNLWLLHEKAPLHSHLSKMEEKPIRSKIYQMLKKWTERDIFSP